MLYKNTVEDIDRTKKEQWTQFYGVLVAQAAVAGFSSLNFVPRHVPSRKMNSLSISFQISKKANLKKEKKENVNKYF